MEQRTAERCSCGYPLTEHIEGKPCVIGMPRKVERPSDLPIFGWAWGEDGRDLRA